MKSNSFLKSLFIVGLLIVSITVLTGCDKKAQLHDSELSSEGVALENYLPIDAMIAFTINKQDPNQQQKLSELGELFPEETVQLMYESIMEEIQLELDQKNLSFDNDIAPAFGENHRMLMAMGSDVESLKEEDMPEVYLAATLEDKAKMAELVDKLADEGYAKSTEFGATILDNEDNDFYLALYKDTMLLTNKKLLRHEALKRMNNNEESLLSNPLYKEANANLAKPDFANFYINYEHYFDLITQLQEEEYPLKIKEDLKMAIAVSLYAEEEGVRMLTSPAFEGDFNFRDLTFNEPYLYRGIPGKNLIMYAEVYDFKKIIEMSLDLYEWDEETSKEMRKAELIIKKTIGLDLKEDVLSWMDKGFAMILQRNDSMVPAISFYVDASSNPEGAQELIDLLDSAISQAYDGMLATEEPGVDVAQMVKKEVVEVGKSDINKFSFDFSSMTDEELLAAGLPSGIFTEPIEFYYGLTTNNYFVVSTYSGLDKNFEDFVSVGSVMEVEEGRKYIKAYPYNLSYISFEEGFKYVDQVLEAMEKVEGPMDEEARKAYELVKGFFAPIQYMIAGDQEEQSAGFLKMKAGVKETAIEE